MYESILVATDDSEDADLAVEHAVDLARRLDVPLHGVSVVETRTEYDEGILDPDEIDRHLRGRAERALGRLDSAAASVDVSVSTTVREGVPHEEIIAAARELDADLIVVGARGRSSFQNALLGSTVDATVRLSPVPVLVVGEETDEPA